VCNLPEDEPSLGLQTIDGNQTFPTTTSEIPCLKWREQVLPLGDPHQIPRWGTLGRSHILPMSLLCFPMRELWGMSFKEWDKL